MYWNSQNRGKSEKFVWNKGKSEKRGMHHCLGGRWAPLLKGKHTCRSLKDTNVFVFYVLGDRFLGFRLSAFWRNKVLNAHFVQYITVGLKASNSKGVFVSPLRNPGNGRKYTKSSKGLKRKRSTNYVSSGKQKWNVRQLRHFKQRVRRYIMTNELLN